MTNERKILMTAVSVLLLVVLAVACWMRVNPWSCSENADCFNAPGEPSATT